jgi:hypothetical protein
VTRSDVVKLIRTKQGDLSLRALALVWQIDVAHLSRIYSGDKEPGPKVLRRLGLEAVVEYRYRRKLQENL